MKQNDIFNHVLKWSEERVDYLHSRSKACRTAQRKKLHYGNALALEEEYFDWYADTQSGKQFEVLFIPYHKSLD